jgi:DNA topoisomerase-1
LLRDSQRAARAARLRHVSCDEPGFRRIRRGGRFQYVTPRGARLTAPRQLARIAALAVPPAWQDVWICATEDGHIQATGIDARGRKQYRYHAAWRRTRDGAKYHDLIAFGRALPRLRALVQQHLEERSLSKRKVLATLVTLMDRTSMRVGNDEYATHNKSYGLTTLLDRHARISAHGVEFRFRGKSGKPHSIAVAGRKLAAVVKRCRDIPGQRLFQYIDGAGSYRQVSSSDVNRYLQQVTGLPFTAKEFRTWAATTHALRALAASGPHVTASAAKRALAQVITDTSVRLGNTPAICRKSYIHPAVCEAHLAGELRRLFRLYLASVPALRGLSREERAALACLEHWAGHQGAISKRSRAA